MTAEEVRQIAEPHFLEHAMDTLAADVVYLDVSTGEEHVGVEEAASLTAYYNEKAFEAIGGEVVTTLYTDEGLAVLELAWRGKHVGAFEGIEPTGREVEGLVCIVAEVEDDRIAGARLYFPRRHVIAQLS